MKSFIKSLSIVSPKFLVALAVLHTSQTASAETIYLYVTHCNPPQSQSQRVYVTVYPSAVSGLAAGDYYYYVGNSTGSIANSTARSFHYNGNGSWTPSSARWLQAIAAANSSNVIRTVDVWYPYGAENKVYSFPFQYGGTLGNCNVNPPQPVPFTYDIEGEVTIVFGATATKSPNTKCNDEKLGGSQPDCRSCKGPPMAEPAEVGPAMAQYSVHSMLASLNIQDTPLRYTPPFGPAINFTVTYNQRESQQPATFNYSNLGPKWTFNWLSYVTEDPNTQLPSTTVYVPGGGAEIYSYDFSTQTFRPDPQSHAQLVRPNPNDHNLYEKRFPDGSKQVFSRSDGATAYPHRVFMTQVIDPVGNSVSIDYNPSSLKITKITDALGQETLFFYEHTDPFRITKVKDPFNVRFATFEYENDVNAKLKTITDEIGIQSQFEYQGGTDSINKLTTPYGATRFQYGLSGTNRWVEIIDPLGGKERVEYRDNAPGITATDPANTVPSGFTNAGLKVRNTFYWDKKATLMYPPVNGVYDYTKATIKHWLYNADESVSGILSSEKKPLEYRVWYAYLDQPDYQHAGPSANPSQVARVLADGTTQLSQFEYNTLGNVTKTTDPVGRVFTNVYAADGIDLLEKRQTRGTNNELLATFTYNAHHQPHIVTDAAGQPTTYTYTASKQLETVTNAKDETTSYAYGGTVSAGYLASITSHPFNNVSAVTSFGYDDFKRVRTVTNEADEYTVTTDYDNLDRKTTVTYPDTTYEQFQYTDNVTGAMTLDLTGSRDRSGLWTYRHYNANRQMDSITDPLNRTTLYGWCTCGALESITDPKNQTTTFHRDLQGRVHQKVFADSTTINYLFEGQTGPNTVGATSRLKSSTDALGRRTNYSYFIDDNISQASYTNTSGNPLNPPTPTVSYTYDPNYNRIETMTDGTGLTTYAYYPVTSSPPLGAGQLQTVDGPLANDTIAFTYDELGRALSQSVNGVAQTVAYDSLGRLTTTDNALGHFDRAYDSVTPRLQSLTYPNGVTANYAYFGNNDDRRLQTLENLAETETVNLSRFDYTYDDEGQIKSWLRLLGEKPSERWFDYDQARQLKSAHDMEVYNNSESAVDYDYDLAGNRTSDFAHQPVLQNNNGVRHDYTPNAVNQIDNVVTTENYNPSTQAFLTWDATGNMTYDGGHLTFEWDAANRLIAINYAGSQRTEFAYDGLGRRVKITEYGPGVTATIQPSSSEYKAFSTAPFTLPSGNYTITFEGLNGSDDLVLIDAVTLSNTLVANGSFESPDVSSSPGGYEYQPSQATWNFDGHTGIASNGSDLTYNNPDAPDGAQVGFVQGTGRIFQTRSVSAGTYTLSFQGAQGGNNTGNQQVRVRLRPTGAATNVKTFVWCGTRICEERDSSGGTVTKRFFAEGEQRIGGSDAGNYYYSRDHLGSIREVTDSSGTLKAVYDYDAYGNSVVVSGNMNVDFGYTGHYFHAPSGLNLTLYRAYNPEVGRWLSRDPIGEVGGLNLYGYVGNNPLNYWDPTGEFPFPPVAGALIGLGLGGPVGAVIGAGIGTGIILIGGSAAIDWWRNRPSSFPQSSTNTETQCQEDLVHCKKISDERFEGERHCLFQCDDGMLWYGQGDECIKDDFYKVRP